MIGSGPLRHVIVTEVREARLRTRVSLSLSLFVPRSLFFRKAVLRSKYRVSDLLRGELSPGTLLARRARELGDFCKRPTWYSWRANSIVEAACNVEYICRAN